MKKILLLSAIVIIFLNKTAEAQLEITPFGGYVFDASFAIDYGKAKITATPAYGLHLAIPLKYYDGSIEFTYERQDTKVSVNGADDNGTPFSDTIPIGINYFLIGGNYELYKKPGNIIPFGGFQVGMAVMDGKDEYGSVVPFSFAFKGGLKYFVNDRIGFRLQAQMNLLLMLSGSNMTCAVSTAGSGCGFIISSSSSTGQIGFTGGIIFKLNKSKKADKAKKDLF